MKIIYVGSPPLLTRGASAIHMFKMCQALSQLGHDTTLFIPPYDKKVDIFSYYGVKNNFVIKTIISPKNFLRQIIHGLSCIIYFIVNKPGADIVITRNIIFTFFATVFLKVPTIYDAHHPLVNKAAEFFFNSFKNSKHLIRFTTNSEGLADYYLYMGLPQNRLRVLHNGVELDKYKKGRTTAQARKITKLPLDKKIVLYSGNIYKGRGIERLIEASDSFKHVLFYVLGGEQNDINRYDKLLVDKKVNNFEFLGFVDQDKVINYLYSADVLVMPYGKDMTIGPGTQAAEFTSPIKLFEYMASRRVIVASKINSVMEILEDGRNAVIVEADDADSLKKGLRKALNSSAASAKLASQAYKDVRNYSWIKRAQRMIENV
ncbi:MAG: glycosyltransferase family 4 protein [Candidatus Dadabacteria bacterium]|nr:glycosyltransferase family 4 protein [Candidatus Dadabacteria bacterium]NIS09178.1 glycosyltransferase family 4 protein [Candidatus Dadabacteria bacterium]NIY22485.1 glycosyltransferase [Candidatus Dadabacteria bacterium]